MRTSRSVGKSDLGGHAPHLPVPSLLQDQFDPCCRNICAIPDRRIARPEFRLRVEDPHSRGAGPVTGFVTRAAGRRPRGARLPRESGCLPPAPNRSAGARISDPSTVLQSTIVGEEHQSFAVLIEPARGINVRNPNDSRRASPRPPRSWRTGRPPCTAYSAGCTSPSYPLYTRSPPTQVSRTRTAPVVLSRWNSTRSARWPTASPR